jgi:thioredoxin reductase (NADPH)
MSQYLIDQLRTRENIDVFFHREIVAVLGKDSLEAIEVRDSRTGETRTRPSDALFIMIGADAETAWLPPEIALDDHGYVCSPARMPNSAERGRSNATRTSSRRACPASSPVVTSASVL